VLGELAAGLVSELATGTTAGMVEGLVLKLVADYLLYNLSTTAFQGQRNLAFSRLGTAIHLKDYWSLDGSQASLSCSPPLGVFQQRVALEAFPLLLVMCQLLINKMVLAQ
jgi:hypothetical protein